MEFPRPLCLLLVFLTIVSSSHAYKFYVGGNSGWVPNPSESYSQWAGRNRFKINDTLVFKYQKGSDSVLQVTKEDYDKCNKTKPIKKFEDGNTEFTLDRSGPFYFISGKDQNCEKGQKLNVVVLTPRGSTPTPPTPPPPPPPSPSPSPSGSAPAPAATPSGHPPSPSVSPSPTVSPTPPSGPSPASSPAPAGKSPSPSPALSPGPVSRPPAPSPATSPSPAGKSTSPSPAPGSPGPASGPRASSPPAPTPSAPPGSPTPSAPPGSPTPSAPPGSPPPSAPPGSPPPPPPGSEGWAAGPSSLLVYSVTIVVGAVLLR